MDNKDKQLDENKEQQTQTDTEFTESENQRFEDEIIKDWLRAINDCKDM
jgi:hypothetical protein